MKFDVNRYSANTVRSISYLVLICLVVFQLSSCSQCRVTKLGELSGHTYKAFEPDPIDENYAYDRVYDEYIRYCKNFYGYDKETAVAEAENRYTDTGFYEYMYVDEYDSLIELFNTNAIHMSTLMKERSAVEKEILPQIAEVSEFDITDSDMDSELVEVKEDLDDLAESQGLTVEEYFADILGVDYSQYDDYVQKQAVLNIKKRLLRAAIEEKFGWNELTDDEYIEIGMGKYGFTHHDLIESFAQVMQMDYRVIIRNLLVEDYLIEVSTPIE